MHKRKEATANNRSINQPHVSLCDCTRLCSGMLFREAISCLLVHHHCISILYFINQTDSLHDVAVSTKFKSPYSFPMRISLDQVSNVLDESPFRCISFTFLKKWVTIKSFQALSSTVNGYTRAIAAFVGKLKANMKV